MEERDEGFYQNVVEPRDMEFLTEYAKDCKKFS